MLLVADVGNTNTKIGVFDGERLLVSWRLTSRREQTADEYGIFFGTLLRTRGIQPSDLHGVALSNVVPPVQQTLERMCEEYFGHAPYSVEPGVNTRMPLAVEAPREVGADRYVDAFAATARYGAPVIVIDFGTATTFNCVNARGEFIGGAIAPGLATSVEALVARAARLYRVELVRPKEAIGRSTVTNLQSGAIYGYAGLVDGLVERMRAEMGGTTRVIATGGHAGLLADVARCIEQVDEHLRLEGLRRLWDEANPSGRVVDRR
ncbi:MAG: type III pantothenate kinase [Candidatus Rokuibacteriota bacterium]|nr:MAG: type III pantothenate kinase [Candidatus Rokubacteria bacterium]PYN54343.1 MAG: type III pantothenate kinase [Candidatus Rokubacteria bacterium]